MVRPGRLWRTLRTLAQVVTVRLANILKIFVGFGDARRKQQIINQHA